MAKVVTANELKTGTVVFLASDGSWVASIGAALSFENTDDAEDGLRRAKADAQRSIVVEPFLAEKGPDIDGRPKMTLRDTIRAYGPTIDYKATGRQVA